MILNPQKTAEMKELVTIIKNKTNKGRYAYGMRNNVTRATQYHKLIKTYVNNANVIINRMEEILERNSNDNN